MEPKHRPVPPRSHDYVQTRAMKIASPILSNRPLLPLAQPTETVQNPRQGASPAPLSTDPATKQLARLETALVQQNKNLSQSDLVTYSNLLQSRAAKLSERYQQLSGEHTQNLAHAVKELRKQLSNRGQNLSFVMSLADNNPANAYSMVRTAAKQAHDEGATDEYGPLAEQLNALRVKYGKHNRANINVTKPFPRSRVETRRRGVLRKLYSGALTGQQNVVGLTDMLMEEEEEEHGQFQLTLRDMRSAVAADIAALTPSASQLHLRTLLQGLYTARHVSILLHGCEHLLGRMRRKNLELKLDSPSFLRRLLALSGKGMSTEETLQLAQHIGGNELKHQLAFLNGLRSMLQQLPVLLWRDIKNRHSALSNMLTLMTELTQQEQNLRGTA